MTSLANSVLDFSKPLIFLAPMEGVVDAVLRELLTAQGGIDACVTEFIRVTNHLHSQEIFFKYCPELKTQCRTSSGVPVLVQLLGSDPVTMSENAAKAASLGAIGIDLNFGCPAKTVNSHDGGAALLKTPERIFKIINTVRKSVPPNIPVSAKIRLGFDSKDGVAEIAQAVESANASWLCIHARTKMDGYKPPAFWDCIAPIAKTLSLPIIANGEVWSRQNHKHCQEQSLTPHVMIGRGLVANPALASEIKEFATQKPWSEWEGFILSFAEKSKNFRHAHYAVQRSKQLTKMMGQTYGEALLLLEDIKRLEDYQILIETLKNHFSQFDTAMDDIKIPNPQLILPRNLNTSLVVSSHTIV